MKVLVLGASENPNRASYRTIRYLEADKIDVVAIGRREHSLGLTTIQTGQPELHRIDTVSLYLNPVLQKDFYEYIIGLGPRRVIFNPGTENEEFYNMLIDQGINAEESCTLVLLRTGQF